MRGKGLVIGIALLALAAAAPAVLSQYHLSFLVQLLMMVALAQAWNMISGMTGYVSFGHAAFFGVGAYTGALLLQFGFPWWLVVIKGGLVALALSVPLGLLTLRLRGPYFAIAMLGLNEVGRIVATLWVDLTRGGSGITLSPALLPSLTTNYYTMLALAAIATAIVAGVYHSRFGLELRAIREDEGAAEMIGVNTTRDKLSAFVLSALIPGAAGAVFAMYTSFINPTSVFAAALNIQMIVVVMFGGSGTIWGPVLGAGLVMSMREFLWAQFPSAHLALLGVLLLTVVLFLPGGLMALFMRKKQVRPEVAAAGGTQAPPPPAGGGRGEG
jgi:branched-chain amino acid transport system permease protein